MKWKLSGLIITVCLAAILTNHLVLDWESITSRKIEAHFDELISEQKEDLIQWSGFENGDMRFQKSRVCSGKIVNWSDNKRWVEVVSDVPVSMYQDESGTYLIQQLPVEEGCKKYSVYAIQRLYSITNKYLKSGKSLSIPRNVTDVSLESGAHKYKGLFYYDVTNSPSKAIDGLAGIIICILLIYLIWVGLRQAFYPAMAVVVTIRVVSLLTVLLPELFRYPLFSSLYYTSSVWNPNMGDLFINCLLIFIISLAWSKGDLSEKVDKHWLVYYVYLSIGFLLTISCYSVIWSILDNSQINMDVGKSIEFGFLRVAACLCVLLICGSQFLVLFCCIRFVNTVNRNKYYIFLLIISIIPFLFSTAVGFVGLIFSTIIYLTSQWRWSSQLREFRYQNLQFVLLICFSLAAVLSVSVYKFHEKSELDSKRKFANLLLIKRDVLGEYYLSQLMEGFGSSHGDEMTYAEAEATIKNQLLNPYFDKYNFRLIDAQQDSAYYFDLAHKLTRENLSDYENIYFVELGTSFYYVCKVGDFLMQLSLKKRVPSSVYPALLTDNKYFTPSGDFDYAVFQNGEILFQRSKFGQGEWPGEKDFNNKHLFDEGIEKNSRHYYGVKTQDGRIILIISKKYGARLQLTNFSFYFLATLFFLGAIVILSSLNVNRLSFNFTGKIQLYLGLAFVIPLFVTSFALLNSLNVSYKEEINRNYLKRSLYLSELLRDDLEGNIQHITSARLAAIRDIMQADISVYDSAGVLVSTSQPEIFDLHLQSDLINPVVYSELLEKENQSMIADEAIGGLEYKVSYTTLNDSNDHIKGFIAMPFFNSKNHLKRQQREVFGNLISIFAIIFILAILLGNVVLNNLMRPLRMVADKISEITLQEENKPILYESSDEIGSLVKDYNSMLVKLEQSKAALARSQKQVAWKEIAQQVAHEIKNPLTPMQLKIQQLLRKQEKGSKDHDILMALLTQVDNLSQIASSFSNFAEMPVPENAVFDLSVTLNQVVSLYNVNNVTIDTEIQPTVFINADKDIFQRILNNIVLNAIQAVEGKEAKLKVKLVEKIRKCEISISDNGKGVADEMKDKIFMNYFSTKSEGSGIGLALAKKGIENAGGNIWFESAVGEGTTFYISMPLATR